MGSVLENLNFNKIIRCWFFFPVCEATAPMREWLWNDHLIFNIVFLKEAKQKPEKPNSAQPQPKKIVNFYQVSHFKNICNNVIAKV